MENPVWMCVKTKNYNTCMYSKLNLKKQKYYNARNWSMVNQQL